VALGRTIPIHSPRSRRRWPDQGRLSLVDRLPERITTAKTYHFGALGDRAPDRPQDNPSNEIRILFEWTVVTSSLACNATLADIAESVRRLERHGEPHSTELLLGLCHAAPRRLSETVEDGVHRCQSNLVSPYVCEIDAAGDAVYMAVNNGAPAHKLDVRLPLLQPEHFLVRISPLFQ
jgi:hypothetical protein